MKKELLAVISLLFFVLGCNLFSGGGGNTANSSANDSRPASNAETAASATQKRLTRADLAEAVVQKVGLPRNESQDLVELILQEISTSLASGETVKLSSFGSFGIRQKGQRVGRNPKTGQEVPITPRRVLVFRPSNIMKQRINSGLIRRSAAE